MLHLSNVFDIYAPRPFCRVINKLEDKVIDKDKGKDKETDKH
jgi:hypothetical protein